nr:adenylate/guanylate cyclase domain-containing protein [Bacteroidota bacterium]
MRINLRSKYIVGEIVLFTIMWMVIMHMYFLIAFWGIREYFHEPAIVELFENYFGFRDIFLHSFTFGFLFSIINVIIDRSKLRSKSIGKIILIKTILYLFAASVADTLVILINSGFDLESFKRSGDLFMNEIPTSFFISIGCYYMFFILMFNLFYQVNRKIGPGVLLNSILGKYNQPRNEDLIFMFLDLKNSTGIAEKLEHKNYSLFLKDCFSDLTNPIYNYAANVYQYVGDEVVLTWTLKKGLKSLNCFRLFFDFKKMLHARKSYYLDTYGIYPEFKAGMDFGEITVTEVGEIRRDLAYHGDVLNTAARIEKLCKPLRKELLITEYLEQELSGLNGYYKKFVNELRLEGRDKTIKIYSIEEKLNNS